MKLTTKQLNRAVYSAWDFQQALSALTFLLEDCEFEKKHPKIDLRRYRCYETTLIISMARPFETSRNGTTLRLKTLGVRLNLKEKDLLQNVMYVRRKIIAHSDEEEMHFRSGTFPVLEDGFNLPHLQFYEGLHFNETELRSIEELLRKLIHDMSIFFFKLAQEEPSALDGYKVPNSLRDI